MPSVPTHPRHAPCFARRRRVLATIGAGSLLLMAPGTILAEAWRRFDTVRNAVGDATVSENGLDLSLPLVAEDGSAVPLTITSILPADAPRIQRLSIFASGNPTPEVAQFEFGPEVPSIKLSTRIRLSESQTVFIVAHTEDGDALVTQRDVRVTTSGCVAPAQAPAASAEMNARVRIPEAWQPDAEGEIITMITHPMTTGLAQDASGNTPPQRIIKTFEVSLDDRSLLRATFFRSLAANPYLRFDASPQQSGVMRFVWTEDTGRAVEETAPVRLA